MSWQAAGWNAEVNTSARWFWRTPHGLEESGDFYRSSNPFCTLLFNRDLCLAKRGAQHTAIALKGENMLSWWEATWIRSVKLHRGLIAGENNEKTGNKETVHPKIPLVSWVIYPCDTDSKAGITVESCFGLERKVNGTTVRACKRWLISHFWP